MFRRIDDVGRDFLDDQIDALTEELVEYLPTTFSEEHRYLPPSVTSMPGPMNFESFPFWVEPINCFDVNSPVREVTVKKGVQIGYTTALETVLMYFMFHIKTAPIMFMTADKELAEGRIENAIIPMINQSGFSANIRSHDVGNTRKTGKTKNHIQFTGGGYLVPFGANNADKMRMWSILLMLKDELDAWPEYVGNDGCPDALSDDRCTGFKERRKIFRGSTPLIALTSKIQRNYELGDQRKYFVRCLSCGYPQYLEFSKRDNHGKKIGGLFWDMENDVLVKESVRYKCEECGHEHFNHDKDRLFSPDNGAEWKPTSTPISDEIRSYDLNGLYSPIGFNPWYGCVEAFLKGYDIKTDTVRDTGLYQIFINNISGKVYEVRGGKVTLDQVSWHRRMGYKKGDIPNKHATQYAGSKILFLTMTIDVHDKFLAVAVIGWTKGMRNYVIDYQHLEGEDFTNSDEPGWQAIAAMIDGAEYKDEEGRTYKIIVTFIDSNYATDTVQDFCAQWETNVFPIVGRDRPEKFSAIKEFTQFTTSKHTLGYKITVDHYKDRISPVLRKEWVEEQGLQPMYHFNAPHDLTKDHLRELTRETRHRKIDKNNKTFYYWKRDSNSARNELWDCLVYGHAAVEVLAFMICIDHFKLKAINWEEFWEYIETEALYFTEPIVN